MSYPQGDQNISLDKRASKISNRVFHSRSRGIHHETHLSAFGGTAQAHAWLPGAHAHPRRQGGNPCASRQRPSATRRLKKIPVEADVRLRAECRLHTPAEFANVFAQRRVRKGGCFHLHYCAAGANGARLGLVIPKKNARHAVLRNLLKRIAREAFRNARTDLAAFDVVIRLAKPLVNRIDQDGAKRRAWRNEIDCLLMQLPK